MGTALLPPVATPFTEAQSEVTHSDTVWQSQAAPTPSTLSEAQVRVERVETSWVWSKRPGRCGGRD